MNSQPRTTRQRWVKRCFVRGAIEAFRCRFLLTLERSVRGLPHLQLQTVTCFDVMCALPCCFCVRSF